MNFQKTFFAVFLFFIICGSTFGFSDIEYNWYKDSIIELQEQGVINGFSDGTFLPNDSSTRAEILKMVINASGTDIVETDFQCFGDVVQTSWYAKYVCGGVELGITKGYEDGTFKPNGEITVLETLAFAARAFDVTLGDTQQGQEWYTKYQVFADENYIIPKHAYTLDTLVNRGRAIDMIFRLQQYSEGKKLDYKSSGCNISPNLTSGSYTIDIGGSQRQYLLYVPETVSQNNPLGLIVAFHGRTNSNEMVRDYMQLGGGRYGTQQTDYIVAYPAGIGKGPYSWSQYENIEFFDAIISQVSQKLCIERDKVFSVGHSLGSYMSNKVSCQRGGVLRAMVGVASSGYDTDCTGPATSLILHLPGDTLSLYSSGERAYSIRAEKNNCSSQEKSISLGDIQGCKQRVSCSSGNTVIFCDSYIPYLNDPHSWPKKGSDDILDFFKNIESFTQ